MRYEGYATASARDGNGNLSTRSARSLILRYCAPAAWTGDTFGKGRDFAAWLGLVPKQISTDDRTILGKISKRGNRYLRVLFVQAAWVVLIKPKSWERHGLKPWIEAARKRLHRNLFAIALANKLARIAWSVLAHGRNFEPRKIEDAAPRSA
jgi:transposase